MNVWDLREKTDTEARRVADPGVAFVQLISHRQHELTRQTHAVTTTTSAAVMTMMMMMMMVVVVVNKTESTTSTRLTTPRT